jgi:SAM-dependent methyltransferase
MSYVLERNEAEYERLVAQARLWEPATARILDRFDLAGATCLDAGCGPGEAMRLMAERGARVTGIDVDADVGVYAARHQRCTFQAVGVDEVEGAFDLVFARFLLLHVDDEVATLRRLWDLVAPGGQLVVMEHDMRGVGVVPPLRSTDEFFRVVLGTFAAAGNDIELGRKLPLLHEQAGIGAVDGADVTGRLEPLDADSEMFAAIFRSMLPAAIAQVVTSADGGDCWFGDFERDVAEHGERRAMWPAMVGTWKEKRCTTT